MIEEITQINAKLPIRLDWWKKLKTALGASTDEALTRQLIDFSTKMHIAGHGILTPDMRAHLLEAHPTLRLSVLGDNLEARKLFSSTSEAEIYDACEAIIRRSDGFFFNTPLVPQILAIRGAEVRSDGVWQTRSAAEFVAQPYGTRTHFSSNKPDFLDSVMILLWRDPEKHAAIFSATVNPNAVWPAGTAHLCDGQYTFKLGKHRTYSRPHIDAVVEASKSWPEEWIYELDENHVRYIALEGTSPVTVVRSAGDALDLSLEDIIRAENKIAEFNDTFVNHLTIKINIHTCPSDCASSLGCQNVKLEQYCEFIKIIENLEDMSREQFGFPFETWYTLLDASKI